MTIHGGNTITGRGAQPPARTIRPTTPAAALTPASTYRKATAKLTSPVARAAFWITVSAISWAASGAMTTLLILAARGVDLTAAM